MSDADYPSLRFEPARGNVSTVRELARQISDTATYTDEAFNVLKSIQDKKDVWTGDAAEAFAGKLDQLPEYLDKGQKSLALAGKALADWSDRLDAHQQKAKQLEEECRKALGDAEAKNSAAESARDLALQQPDNATMHNEATDKISAANAAWARVEDLRRQAEDVRDAWEDDADTCADALKDAAEEAPKESFWDSLGSMFDDIGGWFKDHLGDIGDIAGIVSAVAGALAFIPVLTPICGPIALGAGAVALAAHGADMVVNEKYDDPNAWVSLGGDVVGLIPGIGAVSKGFNAAGDAVAGVDRLVDVTRAGGALSTASDAAAAGGRAFADEMPRVISEMKDPSKAAQWLADKAMGTGALTDPALTQNVAKAFEGGTNVALQVPSAAGLFDTHDATTDAKNAAGWGGLATGILTAR
ncbi:putative T7SS-secreted protein [Amycolatopsis sp. NPDC051372]|uniref:putative T7SS-secreted protein n=1 Tax=unclassified Amycolatopsis TaxID=2618356 RepID=UPI0034168710